MAILKFTISSILGGQTPIFHAATEGQFLISQAIDPETAIVSSTKPSGHIMPVGFTKFSSSVPSGAPMWIITNPVNTNHYVYATDGEFYSYNSALGSETSIGTPTSGVGNGAIYYNDYIYLATPTELSRYGPLSGASAIANTYWNGTLSLTLLTNTTYPATRNVTYPNHAMHLHTDGAVYFCDYSSSLGQGIINKLKTTANGTNDGSAYNVLDLPFGVRPFDIESFGTDLAIVGSVLGSSVDVNQGQSYLFLWDTTSDSFYRQVPIPSPWVTAIANVNGALRIFGGTQDKGYQVYEYIGGYQVTQIWDSMLGSPPFAGAVDVYGNHVAWGAYNVSGAGVGTTNDSAHVLTHAYQNERLGKSAVHSVAVVDTLNTLPIISALKYVQQQQPQKYPIMGWRTDTSAAYGLSKLDSTATKNSVFRSEVFTVNKPFKIREIRVPLSAAVSSTVTIVPKIFFDDTASSKTLTTINNTNYPSATSVKYHSLEIEQATTVGVIGKNNFFVEFALTGTSTVGIALPVDIFVETLGD